MSLEETLDRELSRVARKQLPLGIIMADINYFKQYNDTYGHAIGDILLQQVGNSLQEHIREEDVACRYGGEEFILILPEASQDVTRQRAENVRELVKRLGIHFEAARGGYCVSGCGCFPLEWFIQRSRLEIRRRRSVSSQTGRP